MKMIAIVLVMLLAGTAFAANHYVGKLYGAKVYFFDDDRGYFGLYRSNGDHTPGSIYIAEGMATSWTVQSLVHELCHLRQDLAKKPFNEKECYCVAQKICK